MSSYEQQELLPLTASSEAYPVNPTPLQDIDKAVKTIARYTPTLSDCFAKLDQNGQYLKTSQGYSQLTLDGLPEIYSEPLPKNGMMRGGKLYRVPSLGELIKEKESLLQQSEKNYLPTPTHSDCNTAGVKAHKKGQQKHLSVEVRNRQQGLEETSKQRLQLLPTPKHTDYKRLRDKSDNKMQSLPGAVNQLKNNKTKLLLNPEFTEKMMGFPQGWTDKQCDSPPQPELLQLDRLEDYLPLALCEEKPNHRIRLGQIGNGIVPHCAALMFDLLAEILNLEKFKEKCLWSNAKVSTIVETFVGRDQDYKGIELWVGSHTYSVKGEKIDLGGKRCFSAAIAGLSYLNAIDRSNLQVLLDSGAFSDRKKKGYKHPKH